MAKRAVSDIWVDEMAEEGIKRLYGLAGDSLNPVTGVLRGSGRIRSTSARQEGTAALPLSPPCPGGEAVKAAKANARTF